MKKPVQIQPDTLIITPPVAELARPRELTLRGSNGFAEDSSAIEQIEWEAPRQNMRGELNALLKRNGHIDTIFNPPKKMREGTVLFRPRLRNCEQRIAGISLHSTDVVADIERLIDRVELPTPQRICFAGDSLTALNPQANYLAILTRILRYKFGDDLQIINSGVGGDTIERIENRLDQTIINHQPDWVFILTSANDCKIIWHADTREYGECFVPPGRFTASYRRVIDRLRQSGIGRVSVISGAASYEPTCRKIHEEKMARGKTNNFFGRPDLIEKYNGIMSAIAEENDLDYVDIYTPMKASAEWHTFTDESGVHLAEPGERFLAVELLRFLANATVN